MTRQVRILFIGVIYALLTRGTLYAQLPVAQISGRVTDETTQSVEGATVRATQTDTLSSRTTVTDARGMYVLSMLPPGPYRLEIAREGFRPYIEEGIALEVATARVFNVTLTIGKVEATFTVDARTPLVDVTTPGITAVVRTQELLALPLNGRNPVEFLTLSGAAVQILRTGVTAVPGGLGVSVAGGQAFGVTYLLDGAIHNNPNDSMNLPMPFPEALLEFTVATGGLQAKHGMHSGAAVNAVTRSGTNRLSGGAFEFFRDRRFNAKNPFAALDADRRRLDDGLQRHQFGGTVGGPLIRNTLFFFGGYQGTTVRQRPAANITWVPTAAMLTGDFTAVTSPACNEGKQIDLTGSFVNNRIDPAQYSRAALNVVKYLPETTDPCGKVTYALRNDNNQSQIVSRVDYHRTSGHSIFARYMATAYTQSLPMGTSDTVLSFGGGESGFDDLAQSLAIGDTRVLGPNAVHSLQFAFNRSAVRRLTADTFDPHDLGIDVYSYYPHVMSIGVTGGFNVSNQGPSRFVANTAQIGNDLTVVRGAHEISVGGSVAYWRYHHHAHARSGGSWSFSGRVTGLGLADFLIGRVDRLEHGGPAFLSMDQWYVGLYAQNSWRLGSRTTINTGLRWEPYFGQRMRNGAVYNFSRDNFRDGITSTVFHNAPAGLVYPGDPGSAALTGLRTQWMNLSPRIGIAWDVTGDGRTAFRSSYALVYDFPAADYQLMNAQAPPFGNRTLLIAPPGGFDRPYAHLGGDPHPITTTPDTPFVPSGAFGVTDPGINSPRVQQWNATIERQIGASWQVAISYLGSHTDRLWYSLAINHGVYLGTGPCTLQGAFYPVCTVPANLDRRRVLSLSGENPAAARLLGNLDLHTDLGRQDYKGLKVSVQRRATNGLTLSGNYTLSRCYGDPALQSGTFPLLASGYTNPDDPSFDRGICDQDRTHLANVMGVMETPRFTTRALAAWASNWRISGILAVRSGHPLNVIAGEDRAGSGINGQRVNQVLPNPYGQRTLNDWLNRAAFAMPAPGTLGNFRRNSLRGPGYWSVDAALTRRFSLGTRQLIEARVEGFNVFNTVNWGSPGTTTIPGRANVNLSSSTFSRITRIAGTPRVLQFGLKYGF